jgi:hypothetical protein
LASSKYKFAAAFESAILDVPRFGTFDTGNAVAMTYRESV